MVLHRPRGCLRDGLRPAAGSAHRDAASPTLSAAPPPGIRRRGLPVLPPRLRRHHVPPVATMSRLFPAPPHHGLAFLAAPPRTPPSTGGGRVDTPYPRRVSLHPPSSRRPHLRPSRCPAPPHRPPAHAPHPQADRRMVRRQSGPPPPPAARLAASRRRRGPPRRHGAACPQPAAGCGISARTRATSPSPPSGPCVRPERRHRPQPARQRPTGMAAPPLPLMATIYDSIPMCPPAAQPAAGPAFRLDRMRARQHPPRSLSLDAPRARPRTLSGPGPHSGCSATAGKDTGAPHTAPFGAGGHCRAHNWRSLGPTKLA